MRYFKLLQGAHQEQRKGKIYQAIEERDKQGKIVRTDYPIVPSEKDLVKLFGDTKFQEVPRDQVPQTLLRAAEDIEESEKGGSPNQPADSAAYSNEESVTGTPVEDKIQVAAEEGAKDIKPNHGKDVTEKFTAAVNSNLKVFMKPGGKYTITDPDEGDKVLTTGGPISKDKVESFIEDYLET